MNKIFTFVVLILVATGVFAQSPDKMSYQAVIRNSNSQLVANAGIGMQISILQESITGTAVYVERHFPTTNANGMVTIEIGSGIVISGNFSTIDWGSGLYFLKTETDLNGGATYTITGTSQLLSVPYALHAKTAETFTGTLDETDPVFEASVAGAITGADTTYWNNKPDVLVESDPVFGASIASGIAANDTINWNSKQDQLTAGNGIDITNNVISTNSYQVGDFAHGGIIFWLDESGQHGLVCAKTDQDAGPGLRWFAGTNGNTRALGSGPYAGKMNTALIISGHVAIGDDGTTYAARVCSELQATEGGITYGDWYMPSKGELYLMYQNKTVIDATATANGGTAFVSTNYWSSTENSSDNAWYQGFYSDYQSYNPKNNLCKVRAIRSF